MHTRSKNCTAVRWLKIIDIFENNGCIIFNWYNLLCLCLCLESHSPDNVVDQMNKVLQHWNFLDNSSLWRGTCKIMNTFSIIGISDKITIMHTMSIMHTMNATLSAWVSVLNSTGIFQKMSIKWTTWRGLFIIQHISLQSSWN